MKRFLLSAAAVVALTAQAQVADAVAAGSLARACEMYRDQNFHGCLDQLQALDPSALTGAEAEHALLLRGQAWLRVDKAQARVVFADFLSRYPGSPLVAQARMGLADCAYGSDYARALELYDQVSAAALPPRMQNALAYRRAYCLMSVGRPAEALEAFAAVPAKSEYAQAALFYQGYILYSEGRYREAAPMLERAQTADEPGVMAPYYLAQIYYSEGQYAKALDCARRMLSAPRAAADAEWRPETERIVGECLYREGQTAEAVKYLQRYVAATANPQPSALYILGLDAYDNADTDAALRLLQPVAETEPSAMQQSALLIVGQCLMEQADYDAAILAFDKALRMDHDRDVQEAAYYNYVAARAGGGQVPFGSAVQTCQDFLKAFPESSHAPQVQEFIINSYLTENNYQAALDGINAMPSPSPATLAAKQQVLYILGARTLQADDPEAALALLDQARKLARYSKDTDREVSLLRSEASYRLGSYPEAEREARAYLASAPAKAQNRPVALYDLGYALFAQKKYPEAAKHFAAAIDTPDALGAETVADAWNRVADCLYYQSDFAAAQQAYQRAYQANPKAGDYALFQQALMQGYNRQFDQKLQLLTALRRDFPASPLIPDAMLEITECHIQMGQPDKAIAVYSELIDAYPATAQGRQAYVQMALTMLNSGNRSGAVEAYKKVITAHPTSDEAAYAAAELKRIAAADGTLPQYMEFLASVPSAPQIDADEAERLTFESAEQDYIENGRTERLSAYLRTYADGSQRAQALGYMLEAETDAGHEDAAYDLASEIVSRYPDSQLVENALQTMAETEMNRGMGHAALRSWKQLAQKAGSPSTQATARMGIMRTARELGDNDELLAAADAVLASSATGTDDHMEATYSRALALQRAGSHDEARAAWSTIAKQTGSLYGIKSAVALAQSLLDDGMLDQAEQEAQAATASGSQHTYWIGRAFIVLADVYTARGNDFKARQYLQSLRENYPGQEPDIFLMIDQRLSK